MSHPSAITVGTRLSALARWQTDHVIALLQSAWPGLACTIRTFSTTGDQILDRPLPAIGGKGLFTEALENALREGEIDIAVHSLKDLPVADPPGLTIGAVSKRADVRDVLISRGGYTIATLPPNAVVGTSSLRRQAQLLAARPDLDVRSIRGNVETRIAKVMNGEYAATLLAAAGVDRLGLDDGGGHTLSLAEMLPAPGQGALAVQCRAGDEALLALLAPVNDAQARAAVTAERRFLQALGGGCAVPVAAYAHAENGGWHLQGLVADPGGAPLVRVAGSGRDPLALGAELAGQAVLAGAARILDRVKPLRNKRIVITRSSEQAADFAEQLAVLGAEPVLFPVIAFRALDPGPLLSALQEPAGAGWIVFTSANAVRFFFEAVERLGEAPPLPAVAAVGKPTANRLAARGLDVDFIPEVFTGEALAAGLGDLSGQRVLLPRAKAGRPQTAQALRDAGADVIDIPLYETVPSVPTARALAEIARGVDLLTFTSPSSVRHFRRLLLRAGLNADQVLHGARTLCIGPSTAEQLEAYGRAADLVPATYTIEGMIAALIDRSAFLTTDH